MTKWRLSNVNVTVVVDELSGNIATERLVAVDRRHVGVRFPVPVRRVGVRGRRSSVRDSRRRHHACSLSCTTATV